MVPVHVDLLIDDDVLALTMKTGMPMRGPPQTLILLPVTKFYATLSVTVVVSGNGPNTTTCKVHVNTCGLTQSKVKISNFKHSSNIRT